MIDLSKKYKQLFEGKIRSNDRFLIKEVKSVDDAFMMKLAQLDQDEFFSFLEDVRYPDNSPAWMAFTLGWINKRLGGIAADLVATGAKIDADGNIKWTVERG
jgi:hypothetical protein